ncbi:hypothetical protein GCM10009785_20590 [Brooklawnia cerclae]
MDVPKDGFYVEQAIASIPVGNRHRKDLGEIDTLAASIQRHGLLQPIAVNLDGFLNEAQYVGLAKKIEAAFDERFATRSDELAELAANRRRLEDESDKLLAAHFADAIDLTTLKRHQDRIRAGLADIDRRIENEHDQDQGPRRQINKALRLLIDCQRLYKTTDPHGKRLVNQTFTTGIDINEDEEATLRLAEPFAVTTGENTHVRSSTTSAIVELRGFEPLASSMPWKRATNCAIAPHTHPRASGDLGRLAQDRTLAKPRQGATLQAGRASPPTAFGCVDDDRPPQATPPGLRVPTPHAEPVQRQSRQQPPHFSPIPYADRPAHHFCCAPYDQFRTRIHLFTTPNSARYFAQFVAKQPEDSHCKGIRSCRRPTRPTEPS